MSQIGHAAKADGLREHAAPADRRDRPNDAQACERQPASPVERSASATGVFVDARDTAFQAQDLKAKWRRFRYSRLYAR